MYDRNKIPTAVGKVLEHAELLHKCGKCGLKDAECTRSKMLTAKARRVLCAAKRGVREEKHKRSPGANWFGETFSVVSCCS